MYLHMYSLHVQTMYTCAYFQLDSRLARSEKLRSMVKSGIPHSLRPHIWMRISGAQERKSKQATPYTDIVKASSNDLLMTSKQIEKVLQLHKGVHLLCRRVVTRVDCVVGLTTYYAKQRLFLSHQQHRRSTSAQTPACHCLALSRHRLLPRHRRREYLFISL